MSINRETTICIFSIFFPKGGPYHDVLHSILGAYTCYRPDVGYVSICLNLLFKVHFI